MNMVRLGSTLGDTFAVWRSFWFVVTAAGIVEKWQLEGWFGKLEFEIECRVTSLPGQAQTKGGSKVPQIFQLPSEFQSSVHFFKKDFKISRKKVYFCFETILTARLLVHRHNLKTLEQVAETFNENCSNLQVFPKFR
jgi:hypothetical protein